eukprot:CAMPEP_0202960868 /NCGR_PEP_ID=MMETSP1396-20130829/5016_1 /ASSEMBLY_ACC=CAM_ASM_000872 /TAXON_ID= /ORGANISM="Pseudokeronopsis sp., Strain Brazil" /LENGTH=147 /DNA_ID=CAMNT_0049680371 /DNA_START=946 /DNA_END=1389 /DNA_ORIENTATION=-
MTTTGSMNREGEQIKRFHLKGKSKLEDVEEEESARMCELKRQYSNFWFEFNLENFGLNRRKGETWKQYITRVQESELIYNSEDNAIIDLLPTKAKELNSRLKTYDHTYYFSIAFTIRDKMQAKRREFLNAPSKLSNQLLQFDIEKDS